MLRITLLPLIFCSSVAGLSILDQIHWIDNPIPVCDSNNSNNSYIYCNGTLLMAVNFHELYNDSKTFVDMPMRYDPEYVMKQFNAEFHNISIEKINKTKLKTFVDEHFKPAGSEMMSCTPMDWHPQPAKLMSIADPQLREWALKLNAIWLTLCRK
ncbi:Trehalase, partial [Trichostrongylus colubriformis]